LVSFLLFPALSPNWFSVQSAVLWLDASQGPNLQRGPCPAVPSTSLKTILASPCVCCVCVLAICKLVVLIVFGPLGAYTGRTNMQIPLLLHRAGIAGSGLGRIADSYLALGAVPTRWAGLCTTRYCSWSVPLSNCSWAARSRIDRFTSFIVQHSSYIVHHSSYELLHSSFLGSEFFIYHSSLVLGSNFIIPHSSTMIWDR